MEKYNIKELQTKPFKRGFNFDKPLIDIEARTATFPFSSEVPVYNDRIGAMEILEHSVEAVDLTRVNSAAPLLWNHDKSIQIGVVEKVWLNEIEKRLWCTVRFSTNPTAEENFKDVIDGIKRNVSFGYQIQEIEGVDAETYRAIKWFIFEISIVSIPADYTVGLGRALEVESNDEDETENKEKTVVEDTDNEADEEDAELEEKPLVEVIELEDVEEKKEFKNKPKIEVIQMDRELEIKEISAIGAKLGMSEKALQAIASGKSVSEFQNECLADLSAENVAVKSLGMNKKEVKQYNLFKAIRAMSNPNDRKAQDEAKFEFEVSAQCEKSFGVAPQGIFVPEDILSKRAFDETQGVGDGLVPTNLLGGSFIEKLENSMVVSKLGATILSGLVGNIAIPKQTGGATAYWINLGDEITAESQPAVGQVTMTPKNVGAYTDLSRDLIKQSCVDAQGLVLNDLALRLALAIDKKALDMIYSLAAVANQIVITNGQPTFAQMIAFETAVANANALLGNPSYLMGSAMRGFLKSAPIASNYPAFVMGADGKVNGYDVEVTNQLASGKIIFGNFADVLIGRWGGLDLNVDLASLSKAGGIRLVALQTVDVAVRHAESFAVAVAPASSTSSASSSSN